MFSPLRPLPPASATTIHSPCSGEGEGLHATPGQLLVVRQQQPVHQPQRQRCVGVRWRLRLQLRVGGGGATQQEEAACGGQLERERETSCPGSGGDMEQKGWDRSLAPAPKHRHHHHLSPAEPPHPPPSSFTVLSFHLRPRLMTRRHPQELGGGGGGGGDCRRLHPPKELQVPHAHPPPPPHHQTRHPGRGSLATLRTFYAFYVPLSLTPPSPRPFLQR